MIHTFLEIFCWCYTYSHKHHDYQHVATCLFLLEEVETSWIFYKKEVEKLIKIGNGESGEEDQQLSELYYEIKTLESDINVNLFLNCHFVSDSILIQTNILLSMFGWWASCCLMWPEFISQQREKLQRSQIRYIHHYKDIRL